MREAWTPLLQAATQTDDLDLWRIAIETLEAWYAEQCLALTARVTTHTVHDPNLTDEEHYLRLMDATHDGQQAYHCWRTVAQTLASLLDEEHPDPCTPDGTRVSLAVLYESSKLEVERCATQAQQIQATFVHLVSQEPRLFRVEPLGR
jgi:hypothetical protein